MYTFSLSRLLAAGVIRCIWPALRYFSRVLHLISLRVLRSPLMEVILRKCDRRAVKSDCAQLRQGYRGSRIGRCATKRLSRPTPRTEASALPQLADPPARD